MKQFGETVQGYTIPVLNEREIRGAAGILFLFMIISFMMIMFKADFLLIKYFITVFMLDMAIRVFMNPKYSPSLIIARFMVRNQTPQYVGAAQKRFAWMIGLTLSTAMFIHMIVFNAYGPVNGISCLICMILMFFEVAFGICIGCKVYAWFNKGKVLHCPGEVCEMKDRQEIQRISGRQVMVLLCFCVLLAVMVYFFNDYFLKSPQDLMKVLAN
ncbi:DUF4395 domain-containing protein [Lacihabitans soyangensis]|uniref:DUF4395 domain-containing protein n=1 Tax=Lacihabitans soyangensis TaxID=869394 RepID=A0AAE3KWA7_9BACT|nr:DUF4395 domain-containing protein [Lacihabitans soyangensis]MCP9765396.1 DUF4395 domain-containing protein [Lacihabitans soyangensis]